MKKLKSLSILFAALVIGAGQTEAQTQTLEVHAYCIDSDAAIPTNISPQTEILTLSLNSGLVGSEVTSILGTLGMNGSIILSNPSPATTQYLIDSVIYAYHTGITNSTNLYESQVYDISFTSSPVPRICLVTSNDSGVAEIFLEPANYLSDVVSLFRDGSPIPIATITASDTGLVVDDVNLLQQSRMYTISSAYCGDGEQSISTMNLSEGNGQLEWTTINELGYGSNEVTGYNVLKLNGNTFDSIGYVPDGAPSPWYRDLGWSLGDSYQIEVAKLDVCDPSSSSKRSIGTSILSNPLTPAESITSIFDIDEDIMYMVNPSNGLELKLKKPMDVIAYDMTGRVAKTYSNASSINDTDYTSGMYLVTITDGTNIGTKRLIIK